jgi:hypothetical protein
VLRDGAPNHHKETTRIANSLGFLHRGPISPRAHGALDYLRAAAFIIAWVYGVECLLGLLRRAG